MKYYKKIKSPLGEITLTSDGENLTGLWFTGDKHYGDKNLAGAAQGELGAFAAAEEWLAHYFAGKRPDFLPPIKLTGSKFQVAVWRELLKIPYGAPTTYGELAQKIARIFQKEKMSAQAVGGAVGRNPICIVVPCHRVVGASGSLTGYGGGIKRKDFLLRLEGVDMSKLFIPIKGTAL